MDDGRCLLFECHGLSPSVPSGVVCPSPLVRTRRFHVAGKCPAIFPSTDSFGKRTRKLVLRSRRPPVQQGQPLQPRAHRARDCLRAAGMLRTPPATVWTALARKRRLRGVIAPEWTAPSVTGPGWDDPSSSLPIEFHEGLLHGLFAESMLKRLLVGGLRLLLHLQPAQHFAACKVVPGCLPPHG